MNEVCSIWQLMILWLHVITILFLPFFTNNTNVKYALKDQINPCETGSLLWSVRFAERKKI